MSWVYCDPKSRTATVARFGADSPSVLRRRVSGALTYLVSRSAREIEGLQVERGDALTRRCQAELLARHEQAQIAPDPERPAECLVVGLGEAQVLHGVGDLAVHDRERPVARHPGHDRLQLMDPARVM